MDTGTLVNFADVIGEQSVSRILRDDTKGDNDRQTPAITLGPEEVRVFGGTISQLINAHSLLDLLELILDSCIVFITTCMVLGEYVKCLISPILG